MTQAQPQGMTALQLEAQKRIAAAAKIEADKAADLKARIDAYAAEMRERREAREAVEAEKRAATLAAVQQRKADFAEGVLRSRARAGWQGTPAEFENAWPDLRRRLLEDAAIDAVRQAPRLRL